MRAHRLFLLVGSLLMAWPAQAESRGELLYSTHCITCHSTQMHWRDQRAANDWLGLTTQVRRWQSAASLAWSDADILEVSRYLNDSIYHFEAPARPLQVQCRGGLQGASSGGPPSCDTPAAHARPPPHRRPVGLPA